MINQNDKETLDKQSGIIEKQKKEIKDKDKEVQDGLATDSSQEQR